MSAVCTAPTCPCSKWLVLIGGKRSDSPGDIEKAEKEAAKTRQDSLALLLSYTMLYFFRPQALLVQDALVGVVAYKLDGWQPCWLWNSEFFHCYCGVHATLAVVAHHGCCGTAVGGALVGLVCSVSQQPNQMFFPACSPATLQELRCTG